MSEIERLKHNIPLALILKSGAQLAIAFCFFGLVGWSNLLIFNDFQLSLLFLSSRLLSFRSSEPLLPKPPKITKNGR